MSYGTPAQLWPKVQERRMREATTKAVLGRTVIPYGTNEILQTLFTGFPRVTDIQVNELLELLWSALRPAAIRHQLLRSAGPTQLSTALQQLRRKGWVLDIEGASIGDHRLLWDHATPQDLDQQV
eukprot:4372923-Amphidinium_carterae.1